jgi:ankyrin repeat protein
MAQHRFVLPVLLALGLASPAMGATKQKLAPTPPAPVSATAPADALIVKRNFKGAFELLLAAAKAGDAKAMAKLANAYRYGLGTARDEAAAQEWYKKAAAAGNKEALLTLQRQQVTVPPTEKKLALKSESGEISEGVDYGHLPDRPKGAPDWASLAAAQKNRTALKALGGDVGSVQLIQASLGDGEGLKATAAPASTQDDLGRSPLMITVIKNKQESLAALLASKPDLAVTDKQGRTAAGLAAQACDSSKLDALAAAGDDLKGGTLPPIVAASANCDDWSSLKTSFAKVDVNAQDARGRTGAFYAAARGNVSLLDWLSDQGADLGLADKDGLTPLHSAAQHNQPQAYGFILTKLGKSTLESKRNVTPLMLAANAGCVECIAASLDSKPDLDQKDADGDTALMFAVRSLQGVAAQKLADSGANPNAKNNAGDTPLKLGMRLGLTQIKAQN